MKSPIKKSRASTWIGLILLYLLFVLWQLPALQLYGWFASKLAPTLQLSGVQGRFWQGSASQAVIQGLPVSQLQWEFKPWSLLTGKLAWQLNAEAQQRMELAYNPLTRRLTLAQVHWTLAAPTLAVWLPPAAQGVRLEGEIKLQNLALSWDPAGLEQLAGKIDWHDAGFKSPFAQGKLGAIQLDLSGDRAQGLTAKLTDRGGKLGIHGSSSLTPAGLWQFNGESVPLAQIPVETVNLLRLIGRPLVDGRLSFSHQAQLGWPGAVAAAAAATTPAPVKP